MTSHSWDAKIFKAAFLLPCLLELFRGDLMALTDSLFY